MPDAYREEVIAPGDRLSMLMKEVGIRSRENCQAGCIIPIGEGLRAGVGFCWQPHVLSMMLRNFDESGRIDRPVMIEVQENDGAGGKPQFFTLVGTEEVMERLGWEIITMTADDIARRGGLPCYMVNEIQVKCVTEENFHLCEALARGYGKALKTANLANLTGEVAVMKNSITAFCDTGDERELILTWGGNCTGLMSSQLAIDNARIAPNCPIVGFEELGYRCNGGTALTNIVTCAFGTPEQIMGNSEAMDFVRELTYPSISYAKTVSRIAGWNPDGSVGEPLACIDGIAHITGGGVWGKFGEILPEGVGAVLDSMPSPPLVLRQAQKLSYQCGMGKDDASCYDTFHGGCGMLLVAHSDEDAEIIIRAGREDGILAQVVGHTIKSDARKLTIISRFRGSYGEVLASPIG